MDENRFQYRVANGSEGRQTPGGSWTTASTYPSDQSSTR